MQNRRPAHDHGEKPSGLSQLGKLGCITQALIEPDDGDDPSSRGEGSTPGNKPRCGLFIAVQGPLQTQQEKNTQDKEREIVEEPLKQNRGPSINGGPYLLQHTCPTLQANDKQCDTRDNPSARIRSQNKGEATEQQSGTDRFSTKKVGRCGSIEDAERRPDKDKSKNIE